MPKADNVFFKSIFSNVLNVRDFEIKVIASKFILNFKILSLGLKSYLLKILCFILIFISKNIFLGFDFKKE